MILIDKHRPSSFSCLQNEIENRENLLVSDKLKKKTIYFL